MTIHYDLLSIPRPQLPIIGTKFTQENASKPAVYRKPQPASENKELTETLIKMREMARHNYPAKGGNDNDQ